MKSYQIIILFLLLALMSCKKDQLQQYTAKAIVESYLVDGQPFLVNITREVLYTDATDTIQVIDGLTNVTITNNSTVIPLKSIGKGQYISDSSFKVKAGQTYQLSFKYNGNNITASTVVPSKPTGFTASVNSLIIQQYNPSSGSMPSFPVPITLNWNLDTQAYFMVVISATDTTNLINTDTTYARRRSFRNQPMQTNTFNVQARSFIYYGIQHVILFKLNADYAALYNQGNNNSLNLTTPVSNINNGLGIFTGINADTINVNVVN